MGALCSSATTRKPDDGLYTGLVLPSASAIVGAEVDGSIEAILAREGARVERGQVIVRLNAKVLEAEVARTKIIATSDVALREAEAKLALAKREFEAIEELHAREIAPPKKVDELRSAYELARLRVEQEKLDRAVDALRHREAKAKLERFRLRSPIHGVLNRIVRRRGESVERLKEVFEVVNLESLWVEFDCPIAQIDRFALGSDALVSFCEPGSRGHRARVVHRATSADAASQTVRIRVALARPGPRWLPGRKVHIRSATDTRVRPKPGK